MRSLKISTASSSSSISFSRDQQCYLNLYKVMLYKIHSKKYKIIWPFCKNRSFFRSLTYKLKKGISRVDRELGPVTFVEVLIFPVFINLIFSSLKILEIIGLVSILCENASDVGGKLAKLPKHFFNNNFGETSVSISNSEIEPYTKRIEPFSCFEKFPRELDYEL